LHEAGLAGLFKSFSFQKLNIYYLTIGSSLVECSVNLAEMHLFNFLLFGLGYKFSLLFENNCW